MNSLLLEKQHMKKLLPLAFAAAAASSALAQVNEVTVRTRLFTTYKLEVFYIGEPFPFREWTFTNTTQLTRWFRHPVDRFRSHFYRLSGGGRVDQTRAIYNSFSLGTMKLTAGTDFLSGVIGGDLHWRNGG